VGQRSWGLFTCGREFLWPWKGRDRTAIYLPNVNKICALMVFCAEWSPVTFVRNYHSAVPKIPKDRTPHTSANDWSYVRFVNVGPFVETSLAPHVRRDSHETVGLVLKCALEHKERLPFVNFNRRYTVPQMHLCLFWRIFCFEAQRTRFKTSLVREWDITALTICSCGGRDTSQNFSPRFLGAFA
jgi:hypothetical protein